MRPIASDPPVATQVRAAWQAQLAAAARTPGLRATLLRQRHDLLPRFATYYTRLQALPRRLRRQLQRRCRQALAGVALLMALGQAPALAATINVGGPCTLVDAITAANTDTAIGGCTAGNGADTLVLQNSSVHTLSTVNNSTYGDTGLPVIRTPITIAGHGSTIARNSSAPEFRIFAVNNTGELTLQATTVSGGTTTVHERGGCVFNYGGIVTITNSTLSGNSAFVGGGVWNRGGTVTIINSTLSGNSALIGGGVNNYSSITIHNSTISDNTADSTGGGVSNTSATVTIHNSTISGNTANHGGGVSNTFGTATIHNSAISDNTAHHSGGGVRNTIGGQKEFSSTLTVTNSTISGNTAAYNGGGVENSDTLIVMHSTISDNTASARMGGGVFNTYFGRVTLTNSTISGNVANQGGGVYNYYSGTVTLTNSTVSDNAAASYGGGALNGSYSTMTFIRTLVSGNTAPVGSEIFNVSEAGTVNADAYNLFGHDTLANIQAFAGFTPDVAPTGSDITATSDGTTPTALSAILSPLAANGGPTKTHALPAGSPALDAAGDQCPPPGTDQRGMFRPQEAACDIGAFEVTTACLAYGVQDSGGHESQFFTLDVHTHEVTLLGPPRPGHDLEGLALHPTTHTLYAVASAANQVGSKGVLFTVDPTTGMLWGWGKGKGLVTLNLTTGAATRVLRSSKAIEGLAWALDGRHLYAASGGKLSVYDPGTNKLRTFASNLPGETEALATRPDGLLAVGVHGANMLYAYDVTRKRVVSAEAIRTPLRDIEGLAWPATCRLDR